MPEQTEGTAGGAVGKPIFVYHDGGWRRYRWTPDLLAVTGLGDVITGLENAESEECAALHLYSNLASPVDVVAVNPPTAAVWIEAARVYAEHDDVGAEV